MELILDKGLVIDAYVRVSLVGIEVLTIDARIVVASVDTYLRFAEATHRLDLYQHGGKGLTELQHGAAEDKAAGVIEAGKEKVHDPAHSVNSENDDGRKPQRARRPRGTKRIE